MVNSVPHALFLISLNGNQTHNRYNQMHRLSMVLNMVSKLEIKKHASLIDQAYKFSRKYLISSYSVCHIVVSISDEKTLLIIPWVHGTIALHGVELGEASGNRDQEWTTFVTLL